MLDILRIPGGAQGRSRAVAFGPLVWAVAVSPEKGGDIAAQTRATLAAIDKALADAGTHKGHLLQATIYISDMNAKAAMDAAWCDWVAPGAWPQRACVEAGLSPGTLVEIAVVAARET
jgi:enamine deaminase RidA (YjgF/YER057c/UK114 family)